MLVLVTGGASALAQAVAARVRAAGHTVRLTDRPGRGGGGVVECALEAGGETDALLEGVVQVVHVEPALGVDAGTDGFALLDACTRCTYNLFNSCAAAGGVGRVVLLSTMAVFEQYAADIAVLPNFEPRPSSDLSQLAPHLAEFGAREFALAGATRVVAARLGTLLDDSTSTSSGSQAQAHRWWVTVEDAAAIISSLVAAPLPTGFAPVYTYFDAVNIGRGDGRDVDEDGNDRESWWRRANGGNLHWQPPPPPPPPAPPAPPALPPASAAAASDSSPTHNILLLGGSGMLGPDIVRALSGDLPYACGMAREPAASSSYHLKISDVVDRPTIRDVAQVIY